MIAQQLLVIPYSVAATYSRMELLMLQQAPRICTLLSRGHNRLGHRCEGVRTESMRAEGWRPHQELRHARGSTRWKTSSHMCPDLPVPLNGSEGLPLKLRQLCSIRVWPDRAIRRG